MDYIRPELDRHCILCDVDKCGMACYKISCRDVQSGYSEDDNVKVYSIKVYFYDSTASTPSNTPTESTLPATSGQHESERFQVVEVIPSRGNLTRARNILNSHKCYKNGWQSADLTQHVKSWLENSSRKQFLYFAFQVQAHNGSAATALNSTDILPLLLVGRIGAVNTRRPKRSLADTPMCSSKKDDYSQSCCLKHNYISQERLGAQYSFLPSPISFNITTCAGICGKCLSRTDLVAVILYTLVLAFSHFGSQCLQISMISLRDPI